MTHNNDPRGTWDVPYKYKTLYCHGCGEHTRHSQIATEGDGYAEYWICGFCGARTTVDDAETRE